MLDLRDWPLPMFTETMESIGDFPDPTYSDPLVRRWNQTIKTGDAFLIITPEYNHSVPGVLKNALDSVFVSFGMRNKPVGYVGYSAGPIGGARAVEHLAHIAIEAEAVPLRNTVLVSNLHQAFADGSPRGPAPTWPCRSPSTTSSGGATPSRRPVTRASSCPATPGSGRAWPPSPEAAQSLSMYAALSPVMAWLRSPPIDTGTSPASVVRCIERGALP